MPNIKSKVQLDWTASPLCRHWGAAIASLILWLSCPAALHPQAMAPIPVSDPAQRTYQILRHQEDWSFLRDPERRIDWLDPIKYIPLGGSPARRYLSIGGEFRGTEERIQNDNWGGTPFSANQFSLQRAQLHFDAHLEPRLRFFIQFESGLEEGRAGGPRPIDEKRLDFLNAFADLGIGTSAHPLSLRVGRQELQFGSGRLVAVREGPNVRLGFYGLRLSGKLEKWSTDVFAARPAADKPGFFDNIPLQTTSFWGVFATRPWKATSRNVVDVYYYGLDKKLAAFNRGSGHELRQTIGTRIASRDPASTAGRRAIPHFDIEGIDQFGSFGSVGIRAWSASAELGCILPALKFTPRVGLRTDIDSGDHNASGSLGTFNPLFPIGNYFGILSDTGLGAINFRDFHPNIRLFLPHSVSVDADWLFWWRQSLNDGAYGVPGNLLVPSGKSNARFVGDRPGLETRWQIDRHAYIQGDYGVFFAGPFLRQSGNTKNLNYGSIWVGFKF